MVGEAEPPDEQPGLRRFREHVCGHIAQHQLRPAEETESAGVVQDTPRQVDEPAAGWTLDMRTLHIEAARTGNDRDVEGPRRRRSVTTSEAEQFVLTTPPLDCDMDVVVPAWSVRAGTA